MTCLKYFCIHRFAVSFGSIQNQYTQDSLIHSILFTVFILQEYSGRKNIQYSRFKYSQENDQESGKSKLEEFDPYINQYTV